MEKYQEFRIKYPNAFITDKSPYGFVLFGFECAVGWHDLLDPLFSYIHDYNAKILREWPITDETTQFIQIRQVKEKFGTLRFYYDGYTEQLNNLVEEAEKKSETTCEVCGKDGTIRGTRWVYTACNEHVRNGDK